MQQRAANTVPDKVIIIGAGIFGLSTALALAERYPSTQVIVVDRLTPPVPDGTSVDTTRCIRSDYADPIYRRLAELAQDKIMNDADLQPYVFQQGMTFVCDGRPSRFTDVWQRQAERARMNPNSAESTSREEVFQRIHGKDRLPPELSALEGKADWCQAYTNLSAAFIDAKESVQVYYNRCQARPSINFRCGSAVMQIDVINQAATGVTLENGEKLEAGLVVVAAGAWSNKLVSLGTRVHPIGHEVVWFKVTPEEEERWKHMSITTNMSTGLNIFPPYHGEVKVLRRSPGYINSISVPHPDDQSKVLHISHPRTAVDSPTDVIPADAELSIRQNLREIMPPLADRPFDRSKICWISTTPTSDFLVAPHRSIAGIHLATGGSAHAWKFLPIIGDLIVDSVEGTLAPDLVDKWSFTRQADARDENAPRMDGEPQELSNVVRHRL
ncbi:uncharacterized protein HMPREF1541_05424 [Cyphellophora europaea CBS 101466]|uniref:FAD dependent oxidoreductase domain-containing protein n=1 Tax=Cyphellophora europaea (strain CBS 101466) TaxID=1220924 RepID=W2RRP6_CYPE1|nr:uncharacterized protein HMPREF1541_05424 [Cyphellophora europaea CBS 101466]ETN39201.1 hypothetical protein HMPREF1541_05424 [Cyphellophora europaea CBS 101466]